MIWKPSGEPAKVGAVLSQSLEGSPGSRQRCRRDTRHAMRVYRYRLIDKPDSWLTMIVPDCNLEEARRSLRLRFGEKLTAVEHLRRC